MGLVANLQGPQGLQGAASGGIWPTTGHTYFVDATNGSNSHTGRAPWDAFKTISAAVGQYRTIQIMPGIYTETVDLGGLNGFRLLGTPTDGNGNTGVCIVPPSSTASAIKFSTVGGAMSEIAFLTLMGSTTHTYTGRLFDATHIGIGANVHDIQIEGISTDFTHSKLYVGPGNGNGGIGLLCQSSEQHQFDNINIANCYIAVQMIQGSTLSKIDMSHFHLGQSFIAFQATGGGDCTFRVWKTQNVYGQAFALAQLASNGSNPADGDTVLVRDQTYRFKNTMALANDIKIGASIDATLLSLVKAVNGTGISGTDCFAGTARPTGVQAGWDFLYDQGGNNQFTVGATDTTNHACTFQLTDTLGTPGNAFTFTVTSTNLSDFFGAGKFQRGAWAFEIGYSGTWDSLDACENVSMSSTQNACLISGNGNVFRVFKNAPQTWVSITGDYNQFLAAQPLQSVTVQASATGTEFHKTFGPADGKPNISTDKITDLGVGTIFDNDYAPIALAISATHVSTNVQNGSVFTITPANNSAFTIDAPTGTMLDKTIEYTIINTTGVTLGTATWNGVFKMAAWTQPAPGNRRSIRFRGEGTNWYETGRTSSDVPN